MRQTLLALAVAGSIALALYGCSQGATTPATRAAVQWPSWTPRPTLTVPFYPSWTPRPTATLPAWAKTATAQVATRTSTVTVTWTQTQAPEYTATPQWTATYELPPGTPATKTPRPTATPCPATLALGYAARMSIRATAGVYLFSMDELDWQDDLTLGYGDGLGAPLSARFEAWPGGVRLMCRAFCDGIVAVDEACGLHAVIGWDGEPRE